MLEFTEQEINNITGVWLEHIANYTRDVPDDWLQEDIAIYNKLSGENLTIEYARKYIIK